MAEYPHNRGLLISLDYDIIQVIELDPESVHICQAEQEWYVGGDHVKRDLADWRTDVNGPKARGLANPECDIGLPCSRLIEFDVLDTLKGLELALSSCGARGCSGIDHNTYKHP